MNNDGEIGAVRRLAGSVVQQAFVDLTAREDDVRQDAQKFLLEDLWDPECIWGQLLDLKRFEVVAAVKFYQGQEAA